MRSSSSVSASELLAPRGEIDEERELRRPSVKTLPLRIDSEAPELAIGRLSNKLDGPGGKSRESPSCEAMRVGGGGGELGAKRGSGTRARSGPLPVSCSSRYSLEVARAWAWRGHALRGCRGRG